MAYCKWLSEQEKTTYRLPTEAEWEYACRAGTMMQYSFGDDEVLLNQYGWHDKNAGGKSHSVGTKLPNHFGLFDMHGNLQEWCGDYFDESWYAKTSLNDPIGPVVGSNRVIRGGNWSHDGSHCRSAYRTQVTPSFRLSNHGFRCVRVLDAPAMTASVTPQPTVPAAAPAKPITDFNSPEFLAWMKDVQAMPAEEQVKAVSKKLVELNPGFDGTMLGINGELFGVSGKGTPKIENGVVTELCFYSDNVTDISPVRALEGLGTLHCGASSFKAGALTDLSPIAGMSLTKLRCNVTKVFDLSPLAGMPLVSLDIYATKVSDLTPLRGIALARFSCGGTPVSDLSPLKGMPLNVLHCHYTQVSDLLPVQGLPLAELSVHGTPSADLSPLANCKNLKLLTVTKTKVTPASVAALQKTLPNCKIEWDDPARAMTPSPAAAPAKPITDFNSPEFLAWMKEVQAMPAEEQVKAVSKKLVELNPGFDGALTGADGKATPKFESGVVTELGCVTDHVADISPVRALVGLKTLKCAGSSAGKGKMADLLPLTGMKLTDLDCGWSPLIADLAPLKGMPLSALSCGFTKISDFSPLEGMKLARLNFSYTQVSDLSVLRGMPLTILHCSATPVTDLSPLEGMPLTNVNLNSSNNIRSLSPLRGMPLTKLNFGGTKVSDLSPLAGMPLTDLQFPGAPVSDLSSLKDCRTLTILKCGSTKVTAAGVATLQTKLPKCKIEWADPARSGTE